VLFVCDIHPLNVHVVEPAPKFSSVTKHKKTRLHGGNDVITALLLP